MEKNLGDEHRAAGAKSRPEAHAANPKFFPSSAAQAHQPEDQRGDSGSAWGRLSLSGTVRPFIFPTVEFSARSPSSEDSPEPLAPTKNPMKKHTLIAVIAAALCSAAFVHAAGAGKSVVIPKADLKWKPMGNGIEAAAVSGDMDKGPSRFFLKYPVGLVTPLHHHTANHHVTVVSGSITLTTGGKEQRLGPGSYFMLVDRAAHIAKVEGNEPAVFFIQAEATWDVVMAKK
jgi:mannose-6-phosphate isomerase-like protein (cupin superfamily)